MLPAGVVDYFRLLIGRSSTTDIEIAAKGSRADVLFVDIEAVGPQTDDSVAAAVRRLGDEVHSHDFSVVRSPFVERATGPLVSGLSLRRKLLERLRLGEGESLSVMSHREGGDVTLAGATALQHTVAGELGRWLCDAEIRALIDHYRALIVSEDVRFVLPNSTASSSFLRVADILKTRRDVEVVSRWILRDVTFPPHSNVVLATDTPGLLVVLLELERMLSELDVTVTQSIVSEHYPFGVGDVDSLLPHMGPSDGVVYLLSVSRTAGLEDLVLQSLRTSLASHATASVIIVADMSGRDNVNEGRVRRLALGHIAEPPVSSPGDLAARVAVTVEAGTFTLRPEVDVRPDDLPKLPGPHDDCFYGLAASAEAVGVECSPYRAVTSVRPRNRLLNFRVLLDCLSKEASEAVERDESVARLVRSRIASSALVTHYDAVVIPGEDAMPGGAGLRRCERLLSAVGVDWDASMTVDTFLRLPGRSRNVLLFLWGSVTGASVVRAARSINGASPPERLDSLVVHFRPPSVAEIAHAQRSFSTGTILALWEHSVPWDSAFSPEASVLSRWLSSGSPAHDKWLAAVRRRLDIIAPTGAARSWEFRTSQAPAALGPVEARRLFWVDPPAAGAQTYAWPVWLTDIPTTLLAAASAVEALRRAHASGGELRMNLSDCVGWDMPPSWVAALIRVARPGELWFGIRPDEQHERASRICDWIEGSNAGIVLSEILAADALGKVPSVASDAFRGFAASARGRLPEQISLLLDLVAWSRSR